MPFKLLAVAFLALAATPAYAAGPLLVSRAWVRPTAPGQDTGSAYLTLTSRQPLTITNLQTPVAQDAMLHQMTLAHGIMHMETVDRLPMTAGQTLTLQPGGLHVMLMELKKPLKSGDKVPLTITVKTTGHITHVQATATVQPNPPAR